jgi:Tfp pilus assembly protein FimT
MEVDFKVGDTVRIKYCKNHKLFIVEIMEQICYANVKQVFYTGRVFNNGDRLGNNFLNKEYARFSAIELEALPVPSEKLSKLADECKAAIKEKTKFIEIQDFDQAAQHRDAERKLRQQIETFADLEGLSMGDLGL